MTHSRIEHHNTIDLYFTLFKDQQNSELLNNPDFHASVSAWYSGQSLLYPLFVGLGEADSTISSNNVPRDNDWNAEEHRKVTKHLIGIMTKDNTLADFETFNSFSKTEFTGPKLFYLCTPTTVEIS
ncbi:hypothetical protein OKW21_001617 [Catalinimonas alkaloidigena]|uniref:hypothetical protein n=1 Tax=Catalinimonas alkaloidigena TaxID=1075417 RepID=UPI0024053F84|nr:hypothetical protein [Catalinimonas alkaloidigena]MDF9796354.1 hypothetical protein [Catalinimonas alkaloidigena]